MRGVPGSGKSTAAKMFALPENIFSTDEFWGPEYKFDFKRIGEAHKWNQQRVADAMRDGITPIVVDNTNITTKDMSPYVDFASFFGYKVILKESAHPQWLKTVELLKDKAKNAQEIDEVAKFFTANNIHKVPYEVVRRMLDKWQQVPTI
jgi:NEDD4-binding protein 2